MSHRYCADINLHVTWHTKGSAPALTEELAEVAHRDIRERCFGKPGVILHEIGGIETHVHVAAAVPPTLLISEFIGHLKGGSSHAINGYVSGRTERFAWQEGCAVVSFGTRHLQWVVDYIRNPPPRQGAEAVQAPRHRRRGITGTPRGGRYRPRVFRSCSTRAWAFWRCCTRKGP